MINSKITSTEQLREIYGFPKGRAEKKVLNSLEKHSINFIANSPFLLLSTISKDGKMDVSPRGGNSGFVKVIDNHTLIIPDAKGNNRVDSLTNVIETGHVGMIFLIPGIDETLRINGTAYITQEEDVLALFEDEDKQPITCLVIKTEEIFLHCAKALMRSHLWHDTNKISPKDFPSIGTMLKDQLNSPEAAESREDMIKRYQKDL